jgi:carbohydrate diacid regulator
LIKVDKEKDLYVNDVIQSIFPNRAKDFVIVMDDSCIALVREIRPGKNNNEIENTAKNIIDTLGTELMVKAYVGIGTMVDNIRDIERSYKEAAAALTIGNVFDMDKAIISYDSLGIGRLIYQLPLEVCRIYLEEVFREGSFEAFDDETIHTVQKFFENDLNISETSRQLYVHRNTLVYRLDKIEKLTGLNLTRFDDAIVFKIAMLVKKFLDKRENVL